MLQRVAGVKTEATTWVWGELCLNSLNSCCSCWLLLLLLLLAAAAAAPAVAACCCRQLLLAAGCCWLVVVVVELLLLLLLLLLLGESDTDCSGATCYHPPATRRMAISASRAPVPCDEWLPWRAAA